MMSNKLRGKRLSNLCLTSMPLDGTAELAEKAGGLVKRIDKREFHHAKTRNKALSFAKFNKVVYTVQDAIPCSNTWLLDLENSINQHDVVAVYTDQIPHDDANPYARFENQCIRDFRGQEPVLQSLDSVKSFRKMPYHDAYRAIALDNVCAIYRKESLMDVPFPEVDFAEDLGRYSFKNRVKWFLTDCLSRKLKHGSPELRRIEEQAKQDILNILELMKTNYNATSKAELFKALEQIVANLLGRIYGEVYASHTLQGEVPSQLISFMTPFMKGI